MWKQMQKTITKTNFGTQQQHAINRRKARQRQREREIKPLKELAVILRSKRR